MRLQTMVGRQGTTGDNAARYLTAVWNTALAVATIAGIGAWQARARGSTSTAGGRQGQVTTYSGSTGRGAVAGLAAAREARNFAYYAVDSEEQVSLLRSQMRAIGANLGAEDPTSGRRSVVVVRSADDEAQLKWAVSDAGRFAAANDSSDSYTVVDMRTPWK